MADHLATIPATGRTDTSKSENAGAVSLRDIRKSFGSTLAIDGLNLDVKAGEFISLLGPSGCGKTTLLRMIGGFEHPDSGDIVIGGDSVVALPPNKREVNTVFQSYALFPHMSVAENVAFGLRQRQVRKSEIGERVLNALKLARMESFADRKPATLSGGQQQRVSLARALVNRPKVLLLDEPMSALDRKLREEMQLELTVMQNELGTTFIFVTHDQEEALTMSDRVAVMNQGHIQQLDTALNVYENPGNLFVSQFIGKRNFLSAQLQPDGVLTGDGFTLGKGAKIVDASAGEVMVAIRAEDVTVSALATDSGLHQVAGTVLDISHPGEVTQFLVSGPNESRFLARTPRGRAESVSFGQQVSLSWNPEHAQVFAAGA